MSCGCVYVIERPTTGGGGSQSLTYNSSTKDLSISGGNTVTVTETQALSYDVLTNTLSISNGIVGTINSVTLNSPIIFKVAYWTVYLDILNNQISFYINENFTILSSPAYGSVYFLFPFILTGKYNTFFSAEWSGAGGGNHSTIFENQYKTLAYMGLDTFAQNGSSQKYNVPVSFRCDAKADLTKDIVYFFSLNLGLGSITSGSYVMTTFTSNTSNTTIVGNTNIYVQPKFTVTFAGAFNYTLFDEDTGTIIATSPTIGFPSASTDFAELWRNLPMIIPCANLMNGNTNYSVRLNLSGGALIDVVGCYIIGNISPI